MRCLLLALVLASGVGLQPGQVRLKVDATYARTALDKDCLSCHNDRLKTAGLTLANLDVDKPGRHAETWEKVIRKLRTRAMPPPTAPHPDEQTYQALAAYLERSIDLTASTDPHPGKLALVHRLTRTEYQNAIRDLLAVDALPNEIDYPLLLPADNSASGFDNLADLLFMSPAIMERYLDAAEKISRLAVGDVKAPVLVNRYRLNPELWQGSRVDDLPWGTRGGLSVNSHFPADGEYLIKVQLSAPPDRAASARGLGRRRARTTRGDQRTRQRTRTAARAAHRRRRPDRPLEFRVPIKAGPHLLGITFIERDDVRDESTLRPRMRSRGTSLRCRS